MGTANVEARLRQASYTHTHTSLHTHTNLLYTHLFGYAGLNGYKHIYTSDGHFRKDSTMLRSFLPVRRWRAACLTALRQTDRWWKDCVCVCVWKAATHEGLATPQSAVGRPNTHTHKRRQAGQCTQESAVKHQGEALSDTHTHTYGEEVWTRTYSGEGAGDIHTHTRVEEVCYLSVEERENCWSR